MFAKQVGIFVREPLAGRVKTRLTPPLSAADAADLYEAFLRDLFVRVSQARVHVTLFVAGDPEALAALAPPQWPRVAQAEGPLAARLAAAFDHLLQKPGDRALIIGSDSPDLPIPYLKRGIQKLKHRDLVLAPAADGGFVLVGLSRRVPGLFENVALETSRAFTATVKAAKREGLTLSLLPPWYDVDDEASLDRLVALEKARSLSGPRLLPHTARVLARLGL
jgi:rSAM/selenodomain-associated transferase 1